MRRDINKTRKNKTGFNIFQMNPRKSLKRCDRSLVFAGVKSSSKVFPSESVL